MIRSPLRYPGGKAKALKAIAPYLPDLSTVHEFREPFVGGGSLFIYLKQQYPHLRIWINDLNPEVYCFWCAVRDHLNRLVARVTEIKAHTSDGRSLFMELAQVSVDDLSGLERAVRFFVLNRITFSGTIEAGGYSHHAFTKRFTQSSIDRLAQLAPLTTDLHITHQDYGSLLTPSEGRSFIFLDPPYYSATHSRLYGKKGNLHTTFDHDRFAQAMAQCDHPWLITYDDCPTIRENFQAFTVVPWQLQYGMNNYKQKSASKGRELMIYHGYHPLNSDR